MIAGRPLAAQQIAQAALPPRFGGVALRPPTVALADAAFWAAGTAQGADVLRLGHLLQRPTTDHF
eukprot:4107979-Lingulodinium_polyedra.AAC.1